MMFTFIFPVLLVLIFGALIRTEPGEGGLFAEPAAYYLAGYLAVVVLFTPLSRISATTVRYREGNRFEKLASTPLTRSGWLFAHTVVTAVIVLISSLLILALIAALRIAPFPRAPAILPMIVLGVVLFAGIGAIIGRVAKTEDGAIAVANTIALPMLFLAETFVPPTMLPTWFLPIVAAMPLTYFTRGVRAAMENAGGWGGSFLVLAGLALLAFVLGALAIPEVE